MRNLPDFDIKDESVERLLGKRFLSLAVAKVVIYIDSTKKNKGKFTNFVD